MKLRFQCPKCEAQNDSSNDESDKTIHCNSCSWESSASQSDEYLSCLVCGGRDLWRQKDFPQAIGLSCVDAGAILSLTAWYYYRPILAIGILLTFAALDIILFAVMPDVLVCYRCGARHSGGDISEHPTFDHQVAERYRQEKMRLEEAARTTARSKSASG